MIGSFGSTGTIVGCVLVLGCVAMGVNAHPGHDSPQQVSAIPDEGALKLEDVSHHENGELTVRLLLQGQRHNVKLEPHSVRGPNARVHIVGVGYEPPAPSRLFKGTLSDGRSSVLASQRKDGIAIFVYGEDGSVRHVDEDGHSYRTSPGHHAVPSASSASGLGSAAHSSSPPSDQCVSFGMDTLLSFDTDYAGYMKYNGSSDAIVARIDEMLARMNLYFWHGLTLRIGWDEIRVHTSAADDPYLQTIINSDPTLLGAVENNWLTQFAERRIAGVGYLRARFYPGVSPGAAYQGSVPSGLFHAPLPDPDDSLVELGFLQHEMGHIWGASHCDVPDPNNECTCDFINDVMGDGVEEYFSICSLVEMLDGVENAMIAGRLQPRLFKDSMRLGMAEDQWFPWQTEIDLGTVALDTVAKSSWLLGHRTLLRCPHGCQCHLDSTLLIDDFDHATVELVSFERPDGTAVNPSSFEMQAGDRAVAAIYASSIWPGDHTSFLSFTARDILPSSTLDASDPASLMDVHAVYPLRLTVSPSGVAPGTFDPITPANNAVLSNVTRIELEWEHSYGAEYYTINAWETRPGQSETPFEFGVGEIHRKDVGGFKPCRMTEGAVYRWQIIAHNAVGSTIQASDSWLFTFESFGAESDCGPGGVGAGG